jgi:drug/metabolite transporter (DMT)-like permease
VLSRFAGDAGISAVAFATWRAVLGAIVLIAVVLPLIRMHRMPGTSLRDIPRLHWVQILTVGTLSVITNMALFAGFERTSIAIVLICFYTYPVIVAIAAVRVYGDPLTPTRIAALSLAIAGMVLVVVAPAFGSGSVEVSAAGLALGLVAALSQSIYALIAGRGYSSLGAGQATTMISIVSAVGFLVVVVVGGASSVLQEPFTAEGGWIWIALGATIGLAIPTIAVVAGFRRMGPTGASITMLFEPVIGVLLAALIIAERPSFPQLIGGLLVLAGSALVSLRRPTAPRAESQAA